MELKKLYILLFILFGVFLVIENAETKVTGAPAGKSGAPGEQTCVKSCHLGNALNSGPGSIMAAIEKNGIPATTYEPGQSYDVTVTVSHSGMGRAGFQITARNSSNASIGTFSASGTDKKVISGLGQSYVTHTSSGVSVIEDTKSWDFQWTAPSTPSGDVTFYFAGNGANGDKSTSGDFIYSSSIKMADGMSSIDKMADNEPLIFSRDRQLFVNEITFNGTVVIRSLDGKEIISQPVVKKENISFRIPLKGIYIITFGDQKKIITRKLFVD